MDAIAGRPALPRGALLAAIGIFVLVGIGPGFLLSLLAVSILLLGAWLVWRPGESPILLFAFVFQWIQASIKVFHANWAGVELGALAPFGGQVQLATALSLLALVALAVGMNLGAGPWRWQDGALIRGKALSQPPKFWFYLYCAAFVVGFLAQAFAWVVSGLSQPLLALANLKWAFYWMLAYAVLVQNTPERRYLWFAFGLEFVLSIGGYFSDFKTVLIFTFLAMVAAGIRMSPRQYMGLAALALSGLILGIVWTAVKNDYRNFVNRGQAQQVVTVGYAERMDKLYDLVADLDSDTFSTAAGTMAERLSYVDFFGVVLDTVPKQVPFESGALWWDAVTRPFMPRLLFPWKQTIDDSERTNHYTGLDMAGTEKGTSISIGYIGESYIDFGFFGMMLPIFALGWLLGSFYRWMLRMNPPWRLLGMALATATIYGASFLESSITKVMGGLAVAMLVSFLLMRYAPAYFPIVQRLASR